MLIVLGLSAFSATPRSYGAKETAAMIALAASDLGGVTRILRYSVAQPDRSEVAFLFFTSPAEPAGLPQEVQVVGQGGRLMKLADTQGADCTLEQVWIRRRGDGGPEVVYAARSFSGDLKGDVASEPASMEVSVFRPRRGEQPGDSDVVLKIDGPPQQTRPVCLSAGVRQEMARLSGPSRNTRR